ncbi:MAG: hypothetical protein HY865_25320 [Chloroflexi bacterium]|nr:hypothetical protein [Chloroflexota bacterium]
MDILIKNILVPLIIGVVTPFIVDWIRTKLQHHESLSPKERVIIGAVVAVAIAVALLFLPPSNVSGVNWCLDSNQSVKVTGRLTTSLLGTSVGDGEVQVKIFPVGGDRPIFPEKFARTSADGMFAVTFPPLPLPLTDKGYLVNTAYKYYILSALERWQITDFRMGDLSRCPIP